MTTGEMRMAGEDDDGTVERLFEVATLLTDALDRGLAAQGLSRARAEVLWRVHHGGAMTQRELAQALACTPRNVTGLVDALTGQGLVERRSHPTDRRAVLVALTAHGEATMADWEAGYRAQAGLFAGIADGDLHTFRRVLDTVAARLRSPQGRAQLE